MTYTVIKCRLEGDPPFIWREWESKVRQFLRERGGPGVVSKDQRQPGTAWFNWAVRYREPKDRSWKYFHYDVWIKDPAIATLFTLTFAEYLDETY